MAATTNGAKNAPFVILIMLNASDDARRKAQAPLALARTPDRPHKDAVPRQRIRQAARAAQ
jgi:hypothetical protein